MMLWFTFQRALHAVMCLLRLQRASSCGAVASVRTTSQSGTLETFGSKANELLDIYESRRFEEGRELLFCKPLGQKAKFMKVFKQAVTSPTWAFGEHITWRTDLEDFYCKSLGA